jgi:acyl-[acyl-carrier-protein]-phospholipid O-acyltransferase/long-chain-fatty-acid--[acyl-carrier-protein] ligase
MVPHIKIEEKLHELAESAERIFVVTGVPDGKKGERLVVLHTLNAETLKPVLERLASSGLPNLWIPRANQFFQIEELPHLGSGKLDLRRIHEVAMEHSGQSE